MNAPVQPVATALAGTAAQRSERDLYLTDSRQLLNSMDPAPFRELDPKATVCIIDRAREAPSGRPLSPVEHLGRESAAADDAAAVSDAVHECFRRRALATRRQLRQLFPVGRISLLIGGVAVAVGEFLAGLVRERRYAWLLKEGLAISGWVALWRPLEIFLYDRPSKMDVRVLDTAERGAA